MVQLLTDLATYCTRSKELTLTGGLAYSIPSLSQLSPAPSPMSLESRLKSLRMDIPVMALGFQRETRVDSSSGIERV